MKSTGNQKVKNPQAVERGKRLKEFIDEHGLKQISVAKKLNYAENTVSMYCKGWRPLTYEVAKKLCDWVNDGWRPEYLMNEDDYKTEAEYLEALRLERAFEEGWADSVAIENMLEALGYHIGVWGEGKKLICCADTPRCGVVCPHSDYDFAEKSIRAFVKFTMNELIRNSLSTEEYERMSVEGGENHD